MSQVTHDNHYVPQVYLRQWSMDKLQVWAYRILVSNDKVPEWSRRSISQVAYLRDLYTDIENGEEVDEFEKWLEAEFENPVQESIRKVLKDNPLSSLDWDRLVSFLGAQDVRTPLSYIESTERWKKVLPDLMQSKLEELNRKIEQKEIFEELPPSSEEVPGLFDNVLEIETVSSDESETGEAYIQAGITVGRKLWLQSQKHVLTNTIAALKNNKWCIVHPARGHQWFTSDHPVVRLNYYGKENYDFKGGWAKKGGEIFMPLSPRHLLYTHIGYNRPDRFSFTTEQTKLIQRFIAERALIWIFAYKPLSLVRKMRPRRVDPEAYVNQAEQWKNWHELQRSAEESKDVPRNSSDR